MSERISIEVNIPGHLHQSLQNFLEGYAGWDKDRVATAAIALFLLQNGQERDPALSRIYLDATFKQPIEQL